MGGKLEQSLDECEDGLEREKKAKGDVEKIKRKVEGDLKLTQEAVADLERIKSELNQTVQRKEKELSSMGAKIEDERTLGSKYSRQIQELEDAGNNTATQIELNKKRESELAKLKGELE